MSEWWDVFIVNLVRERVFEAIADGVDNCTRYVEKERILEAAEQDKPVLGILISLVNEYIPPEDQSKHIEYLKQFPINCFEESDVELVMQMLRARGGFGRELCEKYPGWTKKQFVSILRWLKDSVQSS